MSGPATSLERDVDRHEHALEGLRVGQEDSARQIAVVGQRMQRVEGDVQAILGETKHITGEIGKLSSHVGNLGDKLGAHADMVVVLNEHAARKPDLVALRVEHLDPMRKELDELQALKWRVMGFAIGVGAASAGITTAVLKLMGAP